MERAADNRVSNGLAVVLSSVARQLQTEPDVESTLAAIVKAAMDHIAGAERAGCRRSRRAGSARSRRPMNW